MHIRGGRQSGSGMCQGSLKYRVFECGPVDADLMEGKVNHCEMKVYLTHIYDIFTGVEFNLQIDAPSIKQSG